MGGEVTLTSLLLQGLNGEAPLLTAFRIGWYLIAHGGWIPILYLVYAGLKFFWLHHLQDHYVEHTDWVLLAIDVPKENEQSPKAVENIFANLAGAHTTLTLLEKYWLGEVQLWFSLELVSIEGYIQFIIRTPLKFRDLVEAAVYSQYPDAEITEVEDYTKGFPTVFPNERYDLYGTEFVLVKDQAYPLRTYPEFEHPLTSEFKDPLSAALEALGKLRTGEQLWMQLLIMPTDDKWKVGGEHLINELIGAKSHHGGGMNPFGAVFREIINMMHEITGQLTGAPGAGAGHDAGGGHDSEPPSQMLYLPPNEREKVEAIGHKIKKIGFISKIRTVYIAEKQVFQKARGFQQMVGIIKQFNTIDLNALRPDTKHVGVHANYFFVDWRKNRKKTKLMSRFKSRSVGYGRTPYILNIEELATLWHFPSKTMTVPIRSMVQKTGFKRLAPPSTVPFASEEEPEQTAPNPPAARSMTAPDNLPTL